MDFSKSYLKSDKFYETLVRAKLLRRFDLSFFKLTNRSINPDPLINVKPTSSTTAALIDLTNRISVMLEENKCVRCLLIDFTKAFDSVDHLTLIVKLKNLNIADTII